MRAVSAKMKFGSSEVDLRINGIGEQIAVPKKLGGHLNLSFEKALGQAALNISSHAQKRINSRAVNLTPAKESALLETSVHLVKKGVRQAVVIIDNEAYLLNTRENNLVTVIPGKTEPMLFTNIDGAVFYSQTPGASDHDYLF